MPVIRPNSLNAHPRPIQRLNHIHRQQTSVNHARIPVQLRKAADAKQDAIITAVLDVSQL
jgi:hypothetical protein